MITQWKCEKCNKTGQVEHGENGNFFEVLEPIKNVLKNILRHKNE